MAVRADSGTDARRPLLVNDDEAKSRPANHRRVRSFGATASVDKNVDAQAGNESFATTNSSMAQALGAPPEPVQLANMALRPRDITPRFLRLHGSTDYDWSLVSAVSTAPFGERIGLSDANLFHCMLTLSRPTPAAVHATTLNDSGVQRHPQHRHQRYDSCLTPDGGSSPTGLQHVRTFDSVHSVGSATQPPHSPVGALRGRRQSTAEFDDGCGLGAPQLATSVTPTSGERSPAIGGGAPPGRGHHRLERLLSTDTMPGGASTNSTGTGPGLGGPGASTAPGSNNSSGSSGRGTPAAAAAAAANSSGYHHIDDGASSASDAGNNTGGAIVRFFRRVKNVAVAEVVGDRRDRGSCGGAVPPAVLVIKHYDTSVVDSPSIVIRWFRHVTRNTAEDWYRNELLFYVAVRPLLSRMPDLAFRCPQAFFAARLDRGSRPGFLRYVCCRHGSGSLATIGIEDLTRDGFTFQHGNRQGFADVSVTLACAYALADLHSTMWGRPTSDPRFRTIGSASIINGVHRVGMSIGAKMDLAKVSLRSLVDEWQDYTPLFTLDAVIRAMADTQRRWEAIRRRSVDAIKARTTLLHGDFHFKNIGLRRRVGHVPVGQPDTDICAVDFQNFGAGSPVAELLYFMCTSLPVEVLAAPRYTHASVALLDVDDGSDDDDGSATNGGASSSADDRYRTVLTTDSFGANPLSSGTGTGRLSTRTKSASSTSVDQAGSSRRSTDVPGRPRTPAEERSTARRVAAASLSRSGAPSPAPAGWEPPPGTESFFPAAAQSQQQHTQEQSLADSAAAATMPPPLIGASFDPDGTGAMGELSAHGGPPLGRSPVSSNPNALPTSSPAASTTAPLPPFTGTSRVRVPRMRCEADYISFLTLDDVLAFDEAILRAYYGRLSPAVQRDGYGDSFANFHAAYYDLARHWAGAVLCDMATSSVSERQTLKRRSPEQLQKLIDWGEKTSARVLLTVAAHQASLEAPSAPPLREMERPPPSGFSQFANSDLIHRIFGGGGRSRNASMSPAANDQYLAPPSSRRAAPRSPGSGPRAAGPLEEPLIVRTAAET